MKHGSIRKKGIAITFMQQRSRVKWKLDRCRTKPPDCNLVAAEIDEKRLAELLQPSVDPRARQRADLKDGRTDACSLELIAATGGWRDRDFADAFVYTARVGEVFGFSIGTVYARGTIGRRLFWDRSFWKVWLHIRRGMICLKTVVFTWFYTPSFLG